MTFLVLVAIIWVVLCDRMMGADPSFEFTEAYKWLEFSMGEFLKPPFNMRSETARNKAID
jgi:hypothetical protein